MAMCDGCEVCSGFVDNPPMTIKRFVRTVGIVLVMWIVWVVVIIPTIRAVSTFLTMH